MKFNKRKKIMLVDKRKHKYLINKKYINMDTISVLSSVIKDSIKKD